MTHLSEAEFQLTTTTPNETKAVSFVRAGSLNRVNVTRLDNPAGPIALKLFNRSFTSPPAKCKTRKITAEEAAYYAASLVPSGDDMDTLTVLEGFDPIFARALDLLAFEDFPDDAVGFEGSGTSDTPVVAIDKGNHFVIIDLEHSQDGFALASLAIPAAVQPNYQILQTLTGTGTIQYVAEQSGGEVRFRNRDPEGSGIDPLGRRNIYLQFANAGSYLVTLSATENPQ